MSTLKTTNLQNADASSANIVLGQGSGGGATIAGVTTVTGSLVASGGSLSHNNCYIVTSDSGSGGLQMSSEL